MASSDPELKDGFSLPAWIKSKPTREFEPFAASPPPEDSFFFIKYPKSDLLFGTPNEPRFASEPSDVVRSAHYVANEKDWSKHTKPCQDVLHGIAPINTAVNSVTAKPKPAGTDDGFKGEGAACGSSIVKVAHQMISSNRGFTVASPDDSMDSNVQYHASRRGSKSLPVTPAHSPPGSPGSRRRKNVNRYFTSPFEPTDDATHRSWMLSALLGLKKDLTTSTSTLAEEDAIEARLQGASLAESVENLGPAPPRGRDTKILDSDATTNQPQTAKHRHVRPKPTELREMNFWSPTSM